MNEPDKICICKQMERSCGGGGERRKEGSKKRRRVGETDHREGKERMGE